MTVRMDYYTAAWCGPCKTMGPIIEELKNEGWDIAKIDVDKERDKASSNAVMAMPTFIIYKDGHAVRRIIGARGKQALEAELRLAEAS